MSSTMAEALRPLELVGEHILEKLGPENGKKMIGVLQKVTAQSLAGIRHGSVRVVEAEDRDELEILGADGSLLVSEAFAPGTRGIENAGRLVVQTVEGYRKLRAAMRAYELRQAGISVH